MDYYATLGIDKSASQQDIKKAFRKKAMEWHPDRNKAANAEEEFKKINQAYEVLSDENRRKTYDQFGAEAANGNHGFNQGGFSGFEDIFSQFNSDSSFGGFDDIFSSFFGGKSRKGSSGNENLNLQVEIEIPFITIIRGGKHRFSYKFENNCETCNGSGANPSKPNSISNCVHCNGVGIVNITQKIPFFGTVNSQSTCPKCNGEGKTVTYKCPGCHGKKYQTQTREFEFDVIPGIRNGETLKVTGKGHQRQNMSGDLYITIYVIPSNVFKRDNKYVYSALHIDPMQAIVGGSVEIATPYGLEKFNIPPGTEHGAEFTIKNKGIRAGVGSSKIGDLKIIINYTKPYSYDKKSIDILSKFVPKINKNQTEYLQKAQKEILTK